MNLYQRLMESAGGALADTSKHPHINVERLASRLSLLAEIGRTDAGGSNRIVFSREDRQAKECLKGWMLDAGFHQPLSKQILLVWNCPAVPAMMR